MLVPMPNLFAPKPGTIAPGVKVRVRPRFWNIETQFNPGVHRNMRQYANKVFTVKDTSPHYPNCFRMCEDTTGWAWAPEWLETL